MIEYIGKVKVNYDNYCGQDLYSDGNIEDILLDIVKNNREYNSIIMEMASWPVLYHLSDIRENILNWYSFKKTDVVLEVGAGCGAVSGALIDKCQRVVSVDLSKKRSLINAYRHKDADNFEIIVGNFEDVQKGLKERFDYITLIGVFEYANLYIHGEDSQGQFLNQLSALLKPDGKIIIAIENRLGMKYFAGCKEDHLGQYFIGIENDYTQEGVRTFSKRELVNIFKKNGFEKYTFYYPYPDYKLPQIVYSDKCLPKRGELIQNIQNYDADRYVIFDESKAWDGIIDAGLFQEFSNSFIIVLDNKVDKND